MKIPEYFVKELIEKTAGSRALPVVFLIKERENVSEFKIAEKLNVTVNEVRNILYRLQEHNLVTFTRKKDKKKGWYIYYWSFDKPKAYDTLMRMKKKEQQLLLTIINTEKQGNTFVCPNKDAKLNAEEALEYQFKCPICDTVMVEEEIGKKIEKAKKELEGVSVQLQELEQIKPIEKPVLVKKPQKRIIKKKPQAPKQKSVKEKIVPQKHVAKNKTAKSRILKIFHKKPKHK